MPWERWLFCAGWGGNLTYCKARRRRIGAPLPAAQKSAYLFVQLPPTHVAMFRFLLEAYENVAYFTVLNRYSALLKIVFSPHREKATRQALADIAESLPLSVR